ncbi:hypothetical protein AWB83_04001 [Caballeronia ptereochthonis]|uniref:Uncharacterized protein n=1 Tax=Caballeronia ptereochthonis TaxID=1777144 RepID=A0A158C4T4_9BURK|nr:hypothetical protein AWB83_04001 [Caballeronia ptereochthonis]
MTPLATQNECGHRHSAERRRTKRNGSSLKSKRTGCTDQVLVGEPALVVRRLMFQLSGISGDVVKPRDNN